VAGTVFSISRKEGCFGVSSKCLTSNIAAKGARLPAGEAVVVAKRNSFRPEMVGAVNDEHASRLKSARNKGTVAASSNPILVLQQLPRNHQSLDFARALANRAQFHIAIKFFRRIVFDKSIATVDLHAFIRALDGHFAGE
jgi:hypothetical protein